MKFDELNILFKQHILGTYQPLPIVFEKGEACYLYDSTHKKYLDLFAGIAVSSLGYQHPELMTALRQQAEKIFHVCNVFINEPAVLLAKQLVESSFASKVFFSNSGTEANEAAIKLARKWAAKNKSEKAYKIICFEKSFHGRTFASLSATGQEKYHQGIGPMLPGFLHAPLNDREKVLELINDEVCAIMIEPIQGESGVRMAEPQFLKFLRDLCDEKNILLIYDEVQTGLGRTGELFAYQHQNFAPDLMTLAKALGSGLPIGALLVDKKLEDTFAPGDHGTTFGSNALCAAVALKTLEIISDSSFLKQVKDVGQYFLEKLQKLCDEQGSLDSAWGQGLMLGLKLKEKKSGLALQFLERGLVLNVIGDQVIRFVPPLIISKSQIDDAMLIITEVLVES